MTKIEECLSEYVSRDEVAKAFKKSHRTIARWENQPNGLPFTEVGGTHMYNVPRVREWLASRERRPNPRRRAA